MLTRLQIFSTYLENSFSKTVVVKIWKGVVLTDDGMRVRTSRREVL